MYEEYHKLISEYNKLKKQLDNIILINHQLALRAQALVNEMELDINSQLVNEHEQFKQVALSIPGVKKEYDKLKSEFDQIKAKLKSKEDEI